MEDVRGDVITGSYHVNDESSVAVPSHSLPCTLYAYDQRVR